MTRDLRLMCVLAHPDDESLGNGGTLARYAAEGVEISLVTATRGERGWKGAKDDYPGPEALGELRSRELEAATRALGIRHLCYLDYIDAELDQADPGEATARIARHIQQLRPQVVITFDPAGAYGHPDHIAISQFATAAIVLAAGDGGDGLEPHRVAKLYYMIATQDLMDSYQAAFGDVKKLVDGVERRAVAWPDWAVTTRIATAEFAPTVWRAITCHRSQLRDYAKIQQLPEAAQRHIFGEHTYYRAFSLVNGGPTVEDDLFEGLR